MDEATSGYVLLPGLDGTGDLFEPFRSLLSRAGQTCSVVRLPAEAANSYSELADLIAPQLDLTGKVLVGESFSGPLALELAARQAPGTLAGVVLVASFIRSPVTPLLRLLPWSMVFGRRPPNWALRRYLLGRDVDPALLTQVRDAVARVPAPILAQRVRLIFRVDMQRQLQECPTNVLYLQATRDRLVGKRSVEEILAVRGDVEVQRVDGPHLVLQSAPEASWESIQAVLHQTQGAVVQ